MGLQLKSLARLVETDVPVEAKAQQLQIDAAYTVDDGIVLCTGIGSIGVRAIRQVAGSMFTQSNRLRCMKLQ